MTSNNTLVTQGVKVAPRREEKQIRHRVKRLQVSSYKLQNFYHSQTDVAEQYSRVEFVVFCVSLET